MIAPAPGPAGVGVWTQLWRGVVAYRIAALAYAGALTLAVRDDFAHPAAALGVLATMAGWTAAVSVANVSDRGRVWPVVVADHAMCAALTLASIPVQGRAEIDSGAATLTTAWAAAPVLGSALLGGPWGGLAGAVLQGGASVAVRGVVPLDTLGNIVLLLLAGGVGGYVARLAVAAESRLAEAVRLTAATRERELLARGIHDGVLQVLALVRRRGAEIGGPAADLAVLAGEQEVALRNLITSPAPDGGAGPRTWLDPVGGGGPTSWPDPGGVGPRTSLDPVGGGGPTSWPDPGGVGPRTSPAPVGGADPSARPHSRRGVGRRTTPDPGGSVDLRGLLAPYRFGRVTVSGPTDPVPLPALVAVELAAAVAAALDNVARHAGDTARSWVPVEDLGAEVAVSVRDDGPGIPAGRLAEAAAAGRIGVAQSMRGRVIELGGTMTVHTGPGEGTEVEFRVPRGGR